jgi:myo-inositol 2-dehydrogenase / D-chiro-inositol 1-dehydrogenase
MLKVGLLGAGRIGAVHAKAISSHPGSRLVAISDVDTDAASMLAANYGAKASRNDEILDDASIDTVLVTTSTTAAAPTQTSRSACARLPARERKAPRN